MSTFSVVFKEQVQKLARKEIRSQTKILRRATAQFRRDIAALKRALAVVKKVSASAVSAGAAAANGSDIPDGTRFSARSVRAQRMRLGLSAADFGKLVGVSALTIYHWEAGKAKPRAKQFAGFVAVRGIDKEGAMEKLGIKPGDMGRRGRRRGRKAKAKK